MYWWKVLVLRVARYSYYTNISCVVVETYAVNVLEEGSRFGFTCVLLKNLIHTVLTLCRNIVRRILLSCITYVVSTLPRTAQQDSYRKPIYCKGGRNDTYWRHSANPV